MQKSLPSKYLWTSIATFVLGINIGGFVVQILGRFRNFSLGETVIVGDW